MELALGILHLRGPTAHGMRTSMRSQRTPAGPTHAGTGHFQDNVFPARCAALAMGGKLAVAFGVRRIPCAAHTDRSSHLDAAGGGRTGPRDGAQRQALVSRVEFVLLAVEGRERRRHVKKHERLPPPE